MSRKRTAGSAESVALTQWRGEGFPKRSCERFKESCKMCYTWLIMEPSQLIYFEPVRPCCFWGSVYLLHKQMKHLSRPVKGNVVVSITSTVCYDIFFEHFYFLKVIKLIMGLPSNKLQWLLLSLRWIYCKTTNSLWEMFMLTLLCVQDHFCLSAAHFSVTI